MDGLRLYLLGRQLMKIADASFERSSVEAPPLGLMLVLEDVVTHPDSSIREITTRTGFPQSHVSTTVARFRDRGIVETSVDPTDGRRTLVRATPSYLRTASHRGTGSADDAIAAAFGISDADDAAELVVALESLAERLIPNAGAHIAARGEAGEHDEGAKAPPLETSKER